MNKKILLGLCIFSLILLGSVPDVEATLWDDLVDWVKDLFGFETTEEAEAKALEIYEVIKTPYTTEIVEGIKHTVTYHSFPKNVMEDDIWKDYTEVRSLKDKEGWGVKELKSDPDLSVEFEDFNATSIKAKFKIKKLKGLADEDSEIFTFDSALNKNITLGFNSTTLVINAATDVNDSGMNSHASVMDKNFGASVEVEMGDYPGSASEYGFLIALPNMTDIPSNAVVDYIQTNITWRHGAVGGNNCPIEFKASRLLRDWGEGRGTGGNILSGEASWNDYASPTGWTTAGGKGEGSDIDATDTFNGGCASSQDETEVNFNGSVYEGIAEKWIDGTNPNYGLNLQYINADYYFI